MKTYISPCCNEIRIVTANIMILSNQGSTGNVNEGGNQPGGTNPPGFQVAGRKLYV